jgi:hypothetical protein
MRDADSPIHELPEEWNRRSSNIFDLPAGALERRGTLEHCDEYSEVDSALEFEDCTPEGTPEGTPDSTAYNRTPREQRSSRSLSTPDSYERLGSEEPRAWEPSSDVADGDHGWGDERSIDGEGEDDIRSGDDCGECRDGSRAERECSFDSHAYVESDDCADDCADDSDMDGVYDDDDRADVRSGDDFGESCNVSRAEGECSFVSHSYVDSEDSDTQNRLDVAENVY